MQNHPKLSLIEHFKTLPDPRVNRTKEHELVDVLTIGVGTLLCADESFNDLEDFGHAKEEWFRTFLSLRNGTPSHDTFNRVFAALSPQHFGECFMTWTQSLRAAVAQEIVALDGKAVRGHWAVENSLHWVLDVQMGEDDSRARTGYAAENLATLRRLALNLLKGEKTKKRGIKGKQLNAGWDHAYLLRLLGVPI